MQWENNTPIFTDKSEGDKTVWNWVFVDPKGYVKEQNMLPAYRIFPRLVIYNEYDRAQTAGGRQAPGAKKKIKCISYFYSFGCIFLHIYLYFKNKLYVNFCLFEISATKTSISIYTETTH